ncbi:unnamed protein product [Calicophoron daubneyi]|uniref:DUF4139 domain-containing protein n=1 Tax=Calicophoron daubneyi TaxID=300641 RepID=A0AAV2T2Y1_CALDB
MQMRDFCSPIEENIKQAVGMLASPEPSEHRTLDFEGPRNIFYTPDCHLKSVSVYLNKAILCRSVRPQVQRHLTSLLLFKRLPSSVDVGSFRVEVTNATEEKRKSGLREVSSERSEFSKSEDDTPGAYIQDVNCRASQPIDSERELIETQQRLRRQLIKANRKYQLLNTRFQRLSKKQNVLESLADSLMSRSATLKTNDEETESPSKEDVRESRGRSRFQKCKLWRSRSLSRRTKGDDHFMYSRDDNRLAQFPGGTVITNEALQLNHIEAMQNFFTLYNTQTQQLDEDTINLGDELELCQNEIADLEDQLRNLALRQDEVSSKELQVLLESKTGKSPNVEFSYSVSRVTWRPAYDIRLCSSSATLKIIYYGVVAQSTGEDWEPEKLTFSTAQPREGVGVPELTLERLSFKDPYSFPRRRTGISKKERMIKVRSFHAEDNGDRLPTIDESEMNLDRNPYLRDQHPPCCIPNLFSNSTGERLSACLARKEQVRFASKSPHSTVFQRSDLVMNSPNTSSDYDLVSILNDIRSRPIVGEPNLDTRCNTPSSDGNPSVESLSRSSTLNRNTAASVTRVSLPIQSSNLYNDSDGIPESDTSSVLPSLTFEVSRPSSLIRGNGEPQRVQLASIELRPTLEYITIPKLLPKAFLRARMHNNSEFTLLPGPANVYIDNGFNGRTIISPTVIQEEFTCDLGVDAGVQVTYKPRHKYKRVGSFINSKTMSVTFTQIIGLSNTYPRSLQILVIDQLPVSTEDKLKVQLIEPYIKHPEKYDPTKPVRINKSKMVEWDVRLEPYENRQLVLKYLVEYPAMKDIDIFSLLPQ